MRSELLCSYSAVFTLNILYDVRVCKYLFFCRLFDNTFLFYQVLSILALNPKLPLHVAANYMSNTLKVKKSTSI